MDNYDYQNSRDKFKKKNQTVLSVGLHVSTRNTESLLSRWCRVWELLDRECREDRGKERRANIGSQCGCDTNRLWPVPSTSPQYSCRRYVRSLVSRCPFRDGCVLGPRVLVLGTLNVSLSIVVRAETVCYIVIYDIARTAARGAREEGRVEPREISPATNYQDRPRVIEKISPP